MDGIPVLHNVEHAKGVDACHIKLAACLLIKNGSKVYGGFGISTGEQAKALSDSVEAIVAGSVFVRLITEMQGDAEKLSAAVEAKARELCGM